MSQTGFQQGPVRVHNQALAKTAKSLKFTMPSPLKSADKPLPAETAGVKAIIAAKLR